MAAGEPDPEIRASWTKRLLRHVETWPDDLGGRVRARVPGPVLVRLEGSGPLAWLPSEIHASVIAAVHDEIGSERYVALYREMTLDGLNRPLFGPLARGAVGLFGRSAVGLERMFPRAWGLVSRGCGRMEMVESKRGHAVMQLDGVPEILRLVPYALGFQGAFDACRDFVRTAGTSVLDSSGLAEGRVRYVLDWEE